MWSLIPQKLMPPTRLVRYCCEILKEFGGAGRFIATGVRWAESTKRKNGRGIYETLHRDIEKKVILNSDNDDRRQLFETCVPKAKRVVNPIIDWTDQDVWDYIEAEHIPVNPLYGCGFCRVGCVGCPMAGRAGRIAEFTRYPKYREMYISAFERMLVERARSGKPTTWVDARDVYRWWIENGTLPGQMYFEDYGEETV